MLKNFTFQEFHISPFFTESKPSRFDDFSRRLEKYITTAGNGDSFFRKKREILHESPHLERVIGVMTKASYIRPLIDLWKTNNEFLDDIPPSTTLITHILRLISSYRKHRISRLQLRDLFLFFLSKYDEIPNVEIVIQFLRNQLDLYLCNELMFGLNKLLPYKNNIISEDGHKFIAKTAAECRAPLPNVVVGFGMNVNNRFYEKCQQEYYIERLKSLAPNQEDPLLLELRSENVYSKYLDQSSCLGHKVIEYLIDSLRFSGQRPCQSWMDTILAIGSDPRVPRTARSFMKWWLPQGNDRIQFMYEWLSEVDLDLFLQICREYIGEKDNETMKKTYPLRESFLRGLFRKKLIRQTRLFLGSRVREYVRRSYSNKKFFFTTISGFPDLSVFYLNLGTVHIVEGTFSFTLKIMDQLTPDSVLKSYEDPIPIKKLTKSLEEDYKSAFPNSNKLFCHRHMPNNQWLHDAVCNLQNLGVQILDSDVMSRRDFY